MNIRNTNYLLGLKARIAVSSATQERVAAVLGMNSAHFSRILRGIRNVPKTMPDFYEQVEKAIQLAEAADLAAEQARQQVLAEFQDD